MQQLTSNKKLKRIALMPILLIVVFFLLAAVYLTGLVVLGLIKFVPDTRPHLILFSLPIVFTLGILCFRQQERKITEFVVYILLILFISAWGFFAFVMARSSCTGTGMGGNQFLRICQPNIELYILGGITAVYSLALTLFQLSNLSTKRRFVGMGFVLVGLFVLSTVIWSAPFLWVRAN